MGTPHTHAFPRQGAQCPRVSLQTRLVSVHVLFMGRGYQNVVFPTEVPHPAQIVLQVCNLPRGSAEDQRIGYMHSEGLSILDIFR
jgi:hypothetical protein